MSIFQVQSIADSSDIISTGLSGTNLVSDQGQYGYTYLKYPLDLGSADKGHYVVFFINQQASTQYGAGQSGTGNSVLSQRPTVVQNQIDAGLNMTLESVLNPARSTQRTSGAICLYMPDTLAFDNSQSYSDITLGGNMVAAGLTGALGVADGVKSVFDQRGLKNAATAVASGVGGAALGAGAVAAVEAGGDLARAAMQSMFGVAMNPMMELIYSKPEFRAFRLDFMFYPRSINEADQALKIIQLFKFHFSPEILKSSNGFFLVPPSMFDIKFYYNGKENPNIEKTTTAVMTSISTDYAPNGWASYEVPGIPEPTFAKTGTPVGIRLSMSFKEIEYKTKEHYKDAREYAFLGTDFLNQAFGGGNSLADLFTPINALAQFFRNF